MRGRPQERAKSVNGLYVEQSVALFAPFVMDRSDISFAARLMAHWANLDEREPSVKIVCRNYSEKPQPGLHNWDCPNLLWELMRTRRVKLTAQQLLSRNLAEAIVDKDNHARDVMKYITMSHPEPSVKTVEQRAAEAVKTLVEAGDLTSAVIRYQQIMEEATDCGRPMRSGRRRWPNHESKMPVNCFVDLVPDSTRIRAARNPRCWARISLAHLRCAAHQCFSHSRIKWQRRRASALENSDLITPSGSKPRQTESASPILSPRSQRNAALRAQLLVPQRFDRIQSRGANRRNHAAN